MSCCFLKATLILIKHFLGCYLFVSEAISLKYAVNVDASEVCSLHINNVEWEALDLFGFLKRKKIHIPSIIFFRHLHRECATIVSSIFVLLCTFSASITIPYIRLPHGWPLAARHSFSCICLKRYNFASLYAI